MLEPLQLPLDLHPAWRGEWVRARDAYLELLDEVATAKKVKRVTAGLKWFDDPDEWGGHRNFCVFGPRGRVIMRSRGPAHPAPDALSPGYWLYMENALRRCLREWGCRLCGRKSYLGRSGICVDCRKANGLHVVRPLHEQLALAMGTLYSELQPVSDLISTGRVA